MKPYRNIMIGVVGSILVLVALVLISGGEEKKQPAANASAPLTVKAEEKSYDFGTISMRSGTVTHAFKIENKSNETLTVKKLYTSCMCTTATLITKDDRVGPFGMPGHGFIPSIDAAVAPNEEATVEVVFDPAAHGPAGVGRIDRVVTVETAGGPLRFGITANVTP